MKIFIPENAFGNVVWKMTAILSWPYCVNTLRPRQNGRRFPDNIFKCISLDENVWISLQMSLKFVPKVRINNIPALVWIMAWRRTGDKPLSEPMMGNSVTHICVTRPQWVNGCLHRGYAFIESINTDRTQTIVILAIVIYGLYPSMNKAYLIWAD